MGVAECETLDTLEWQLKRMRISAAAGHEEELEGFVGGRQQQVPHRSRTIP
jgi:hypothetical protein